MPPIPARALLACDAHRPWPLPRAPWVAYQRWTDCLFLHWPLPPERLRALLPRGLALDTRDGKAWVSITAFRLQRFRMRPLGLPLMRASPELNLRTYVRCGAQAGVWFFSLDLARVHAVLGARLSYSLPYHPAWMRLDRDGDRLAFASRRVLGGAGFACRWRPRPPARPAAPGSLEHFLFERYALFSRAPGGVLLRGDIHHRPWLIADADVDLQRCTVTAAAGLDAPPGDLLRHHADPQDVLQWPPMPARC